MDFFATLIGYIYMPNLNIRRSNLLRNPAPSVFAYPPLTLQIIDSKTPFDEEPLFLYLAHQAVHDPLGLPGNGKKYGNAFP